MGRNDAPVLDARRAYREVEAPMALRTRSPAREDLVVFRDSPDGRRAGRALPASTRIASYGPQRRERFFALPVSRLEARRRRQMSSRCLRSRSKRLLCEGEAPAYPCKKQAARLGMDGRSADNVARSSVRLLRRPTDTKVSVVKFVVPSIGADLEGAIDSAHSSTLHSPTCGRRRCRPKATDRVGSTVDGQGPKLHGCSRRRFAFATPRSPADLQRRNNQYVRTTLFVAPITVLIPPNDVYTSRTSTCRSTTRTRCPFHRMERIRRGPRHRDVAQILRRGSRAIDLDANWSRGATLANHHLQDRQAMKLGDFTGIRAFRNAGLAMWASMGRSPTALATVSVRATWRSFEFRRIHRRGGTPIRCRRRRDRRGRADRGSGRSARFEGVIPKDGRLAYARPASPERRPVERICRRRRHRSDVATRGSDDEIAPHFRYDLRPPDGGELPPFTAAHTSRYGSERRTRCCSLANNPLERDVTKSPSSAGTPAAAARKSLVDRVRQATCCGVGAGQLV